MSMAVLFMIGFAMGILMAIMITWHELKKYEKSICELVLCGETATRLLKLYSTGREVPLHYNAAAQDAFRKSIATVHDEGLCDGCDIQMPDSDKTHCFNCKKGRKSYEKK